MMQKYREWTLKNQFRIPRSNEYLVERFKNELTYNDMVNLYVISVNEVLKNHKVEVLTDIPWGRGYFEAKKRWEEKIINNIRKR